MNAARKRERDKNRRKIHFKRVEVQLKPIGDLDSRNQPVNKARLILNDLSFKGLAVLAMEPLVEGQLVSLTIEEPKQAYLSARVSYCTEADPNTRIIREKPYLFRVGLVFVFESEDEERAVREYCDEVAQRFLNYAPKDEALPKAA